MGKINKISMSSVNHQPTTTSQHDCEQEIRNDIDNGIFHYRDWPYSTFVADDEQYLQYLPAKLEVMPYEKKGGAAERRFLNSRIHMLKLAANELSEKFINSDGYGTSEFRPNCHVNPHLEVMTQSFRMRVQEFLVLYTCYSAQMPRASRIALQAEFAKAVAVWFEHNFAQEWQRAQGDSFYGDAQYYYRVASLEFYAFPQDFQFAIDLAYLNLYGNSFSGFLNSLKA